MRGNHQSFSCVRHGAVGAVTIFSSLPGLQIPDEPSGKGKRVPSSLELFRTRFLFITVWWTLLTPALAINIGNTTISDTLVVPAGETGNLFGTITLTGGVIDVQGYLQSQLQAGDIIITGTGVLS